MTGKSASHVPLMTLLCLTNTNRIPWMSSLHCKTACREAPVTAYSHQWSLSLPNRCSQSAPQV